MILSMALHADIPQQMLGQSRVQALACEGELRAKHQT